MKQKIINKIIKIYEIVTHFFIVDLFQLLLLLIRLWIANIFLRSGLLKITDWETTLQLFELQYKVPYMNYKDAAIIATIFELFSPVLIIFGFMSRIAVIPLIVMTIVIQLNVFHLSIHYYWLFLMFTILLYGPGNISIDYLLRERFIERFEKEKAGKISKKVKKA